MVFFGVAIFLGATAFVAGAGETAPFAPFDFSADLTLQTNLSLKSRPALAPAATTSFASISVGWDKMKPVLLPARGPPRPLGAGPALGDSTLLGVVEAFVFLVVFFAAMAAERTTKVIAYQEGANPESL